MKRGKPLERKTPLRARSTLKSTKRLDRGKPLAPRSEKRKAEAPRRAKVRATVLARDKGCRAFGLAPGPCRSPFPDRPPLEVHEVIPRSLWAAGYLVVSNCVAVCQVHHDWITDHDPAARALGLSASFTTGVDDRQEDL